MPTNPTLYRYMGSHILDTLEHQHLKTSSIFEFNDPFECLPCFYLSQDQQKLIQARERRDIRDDVPSERFLEAIEKHKKHLTDNMQAIHHKNYRVICFSKNESTKESNLKDAENNLMWGHYTWFHTGARIGFDFSAIKDVDNPSHVLFDVRYVKERLKYDLLDHLSDENKRDELVDEMFHQKDEQWKCEKEWRLIINLNCASSRVKLGLIEEKGKTKEAFFFTFDKKWVTRVDFGLKMDPDKRAEILNLIKYDKDYDHVQCYDAKLHPSEYALTYEPIDLK